jgi:hypothetical protein
MNKINDRLKEKLILKRLEQVYCRLAPSNISGIGIFAIKEIPKDINPFNNSYMAQESVIIDRSKITDSEIISLLHDQHPTSDPNKQIVSNFPNQLIWTNYINYSDIPNIELMVNGEWKTLRKIEKGEELLEDVNRLFNADGSQKIFKITSKQYPNLTYSL